MLGRFLTSITSTWREERVFCSRQFGLFLQLFAAAVVVIVAAKGAEEEGGTVMVFVELVGVEMVVASMVVLASSRPETLRAGEPWVLRLLLLPLRKILPGDRLLRLRLMEEVDGNMHLSFFIAGGKDGDGVAGWDWYLHRERIKKSATQASSSSTKRRM